MKHLETMREQLKTMKKNLETARNNVDNMNNLSNEELKDYIKIVVQEKGQLYPEILRILNESLNTLNEVLNEEGDYRKTLTSDDFVPSA